MSSVFALVPYTTSFTPALLKYSVKIPKSMITNPTWVKIRNFSAAYRRFFPSQIPIKQYIGGRTSSQKRANKKKTNAIQTTVSAVAMVTDNPKEARGQRCSFQR